MINRNKIKVARKPRAQGSTRYRRSTVLLVDDECFIREAITLMLKYKWPGMRVLESSDSVEALRLATTHKIDLVLSDIARPRRTDWSSCGFSNGHIPRFPW